MNDIDTAPLNRNVTPSTGLTLCIVNSSDRAAAQGISQKLFLVTITSIAVDDTIDLTTTAWDIPR